VLKWLGVCALWHDDIIILHSGLPLWRRDCVLEMRITRSSTASGVHKLVRPEPSNAGHTVLYFLQLRKGGKRNILRVCYIALYRVARTVSDSWETEAMWPRDSSIIDDRFLGRLKQKQFG
jgi:hypothetical protein